MSENALEPKDWDAFRAEARALLDDCIDMMQKADQSPWIHPPTDLQETYEIGRGGDLMARLRDEVMPYHSGVTHPKFWGWVQGTGLATDLTAGLVQAAMNTSVGGRNNGGNYMERAVIDWTRQKMGMPDTASGVLVTGTSQATVIGLAAARGRALNDVRAVGLSDRRLTCYAGQGVHNATRKAVELLGIGADNLRSVPLKDGQIDLDILSNMISKDREDGAIPMAIVGTAGSVDLGLYDDLNALADLAADEAIWLHVDGAFGAWTRLAEGRYRSLSDGIGRADSLALDFHKWMFVGYDCGLALVRNEEEHRAAFALRPAYLGGKERGTASGDPWFCDYGIDLSRSNRALKVWLALEQFGEDAFGEAITRNCDLARVMADEVSKHEGMWVAMAPISNVCVFSARADLSPDAQSKLNAEIAIELQESGEAVFSTTVVSGIEMLRAAIVNHRSSETHVRDAVQAVARMAEKLTA